MEAFIRKISVYLREKNRTRNVRNILLGFAAVVVFITTYSLILPAISLDQDTSATNPAIVLEENKTEESPAAGETEAAPEKYQAGERVFRGDGFTLTVAYDENAGLTSSAELHVTELIEEARDKSEEYDYVNREYYNGYLDGTLAAIRKNVDDRAELSDVRFLNISFMQDGKAVTPEGIVHVTIEYGKPVEIDSDVIMKAVHFDSTREEPVVLPVKVTGDKAKGNQKNIVEKISFDTSRISFYAITNAVLKEE